VTLVVDGVAVEIRGETSAFIRDIRGASQETSKNAKKMRKDLSGVSSGFSSLAKGVRAAVGVFGLGVLLKTTIQITNNMTRLRGRLKQVVQDAASLEAVERELVDTTLDLGTSLEGAITLFQRLSFARKELEAGDAELLQFSKTVQQLGLISGASAEQMKNGTLQLTQGLNSSVLRAEEFNSITENMPAVAIAIAKGMGKSAGELRNMVIAGKVASKEVFSSILLQTEEIQKKFEELPPDFERSMTKVSTAIGLGLDAVERRYGTVQALAEGISGSVDTLFPDLESEIATTSKSVTDLEERIALLTKRVEQDSGKMNFSQWLFNSGSDKDKSTAALARFSDDLQRQKETLKGLLELQKKQKELAGGDNSEPPELINPGALKLIKKLSAEIDVLTAKTQPGKVFAALGLDPDDPENSEIVQQIFDLVTVLGDLKEAETALQQSRSEAATIVEETLTKEEALVRLRERMAEIMPQMVELVGSEAKAREVIARALDREEKAWDRRNKKQDEAIRLSDAFGSAAESNFERAIFDGEAFDKVLLKLIEDLARLVIRQALLAPLAKGFGSFIGGILPGFAGGGRIQPGVPTIVGERGPELIVPSRSGTVMNAADSKSAMSGGSPVINVNNYFDLVPGPTIGAMIDQRMPEVRRTSAAQAISILNGRG